MDRYGASTREFESDDDYGYDYPRRGGRLDRDDDYDRGYGRGDLTRERETFPGERSGRDHRSGVYDDEDSDFGRYDGPTHRGLPDRRGTGPYAFDASIDEREFEPRDHLSRSADAVRGAGPRRRDFSPTTLDSYDNDSEFEHGAREGPRGHRSRRGAISGRPGSRFNGEYSDDESEFEPRATREGHSGPGLRRGAEPRLRPFSSEYSEDESDFGPRLAREEYGHGGRRSMAAPHADHRGLARPSSTDDESEDEQYGYRQGYGRDARGGMHPRRRGQDHLSDDDLDDSEDEGMRGGRRAAPSFGGSSRREFY